MTVRADPMTRADPGPRAPLSAGDLLALATGSYLRLGRSVFQPGPWSLRRAVALTVAVPLLFAYVTALWAFLLLDELLHPGYRRTSVEEPLFVLGMPRSGTTFLHGTLARDDERFTVRRLWELLFAPTVTQRRLVAVLSRLDRRLGRPAARCGGWLQTRLTKAMDGVHPARLDGPGEDFLLLMPAFACFLLVVPFPASDAIWELTRIDDWPEGRRHRLARFYRAALQRHLYADALIGRSAARRILSKNPSFSAWPETLAETFPDARFIYCFRDPGQAIPSQLSSIRPGASLFGYDPAREAIPDRFVEMYESFARRGVDVLGPARLDRAAFLSLDDLSADVSATVEAVYHDFGWHPSDGFRRALAQRASRARRHRSHHRYSSEEFGLDAEALAARFRPSMRRLEALTTSGIPA